MATVFWRKRSHASALSGAVRCDGGDVTLLCEEHLVEARDALAANFRKAISLIDATCPAQYRRIRRVKSDFLVKRAGSSAFWAEVNTCLITSDLARKGGPDLALSIVHESTHAMLHAMGVPWRPRYYARIERLCLRREMAFCRALERRGYGVEARLEWYRKRLKSDFYTPELLIVDRIRNAEAHGRPRWHTTFLRWRLARIRGRRGGEN
jgi:hypothetical protein